MGRFSGRRLLVANALLLLSAVLCSCSEDKAQQRPAQEAVPVTVAEVARKDVPVELQAIGRVEPQSSVSVRAQVGGVLTRVNFKEGEDVKTSAPLFTIDTRPFEAALRQLEANLARDQAQADNARRDEERYEELVKKDYITKEEYDQIRVKTESFDATVRADKAAVENARVQLGYCSIRSPIDGRTGKLMVHQGNLVKANSDDPLVVINRIDPIDVAFSVPEQQLPEIKRRQAGGKLRVEAAPQGEGSEPASGELSFIDNEVDAGTGTILLKATFSNKSRTLWPGQFVTVNLRLATVPGALVVPSQAVQNGQLGPFLFVVKPDMTVESRPIVAGAARDAEVVVEKGVEAGERVVTDGQLRLVPGSRVEVKAGP